MLNFASPHCHPASFDSASTPEAFADREVELGTGVLVCTDHGSMGAARKVYDLAQKKQLVPVCGIEGYFRDDDCPILKAHGITPGPAYLKYMHVTLHARDEAAFEVLSRKISLARLEGGHGSQGKPLWNWADMEEILAQNVTSGSSCLVGMVSRHLLREGLPPEERYAIARDYYDRLRSLTRPGNFFVELFPHRCTHNWESGFFLETAAGERTRYWPGKKLRFRHLGEVTAEEAAQAFGTRRWTDGDELVAVKDYSKWVEREPVPIKLAEKLEKFLQNECVPDFCSDGDVQLTANQIVQSLAEDYGDPILVSDDSHYTDPSEKVVQDVRLATMGPWRFYGEYHRQTSAEAYAYFKTYMGTSEARFEGWVENSRAWVEGFRGFKFTQGISLPTKFFPTDTVEETLRRIDVVGRMRWEDPVYAARLQQEIELFSANGKLDLLPYFWLGQEAVQVYEKAGLLTGPGRGSAAGALVTYLLGITHVDPIRWNLSLDRLLTLDRIRSGKLPDVDQDLPDRDLLIDPKDPTKGWLPERFGDHYVQIGTSTSMRLKSSALDVLRARLGFIPPSAVALIKSFQVPPQGLSDYKFVFGYRAEGEDVAGSITFDTALQQFAKTYPRDWATVVKCLGLSRQRGRHASAFVIANRPCHEFLPLVKTGGVMTTQYDMGDVEAAGGLKMDFLCINSLKDIQGALKLIQARSGRTFADAQIDGVRVPGFRILPHQGRDYDIWDLPEDQDVFHDVAGSQTETVFQFATPGATMWLPHFNEWKNRAEKRKAIDSVEAMSIFTALDRPGPLDAKVSGPNSHNMLVEYARRARGEAPLGEPSLVQAMQRLIPETHGVLVFQESLQRLYQQLMGCTGPEAEEFRSNVAKKKMEKVLLAYDPWMAKVGDKLGAPVAQAAWDQICTFGQYGFNKSHSVCYAHIAYACAFLKHHYPLEWWCGVLRNADKKEIAENFWRYCGPMTQLPEISVSGDRFEVVGDKIVAPLNLLHGVGPGAHDQIQRYRPYADVADFCTKMRAHCVAGAKPTIDKKTGKQKVRVVKAKPRKGEPERTELVFRNATDAVNRAVAYSLIIAGAFDSLFPSTVLVGDTQMPITDLDKLKLYEAALATARGEKRPQAVDPDMANLSALKRYQRRRMVLPVYSEPLLPLIQAQSRRVMVSTKTGEPRLFWPQDEGEIEFLSMREVRALDRLEVVPYTLRAGLPGYVVSQRPFEFKGGQQACEFIIDSDGEVCKWVKWPERRGPMKGILDPVYTQDWVGAVVVVSIEKWKAGKGFALDRLYMVEPPVAPKEKKNDDSNREEEAAEPEEAAGSDPGVRPDPEQGYDAPGLGAS